MHITPSLGARTATLLALIAAPGLLAQSGGTVAQQFEKLHFRSIGPAIMSGRIADVTVYGPRNPEIKGAVVAFNVEGIHPHDGAALLDQRGIAVRAGHHCAQPLMKRLGIGGTLRASFSVYTSEADIARLAAAVADMKRDL